MGKDFFWDSFEELSMSFGLKADRGAHVGKTARPLTEAPSRDLNWLETQCMTRESTT